MRLLELDIQNVRGLPDVQLSLDGQTLVIWGPNGAGKSGVVDAVDFVLTGRISRLLGEGTQGISLVKHGPHIDHDPESAVVTATLQLDGFPEPVTISRCMAAAGHLECPDEAKPILDQVEGIARRGGLILTRRDILRFVTAEAGTRAQEIIELLNLSEIDDRRGAIYRARTELRRHERAAQVAIDTAKAEVNVTLQEDTFSDQRLLEVINKCREGLGGQPNDVSTAATIKSDLRPPILPSAESSFNPDLFTKVIDNIRDGVRTEILDQVSKSDEELRQFVADIKAHTELLSALEFLELAEHAVRVVGEDTTECPVCGTSWPVGELKRHLEARIIAGQAAQEGRQKMAATATLIAGPMRNVRANLQSLLDVAAGLSSAQALEADITTITVWGQDLDGVLQTLELPHESYPPVDIPPSSVGRLFAPSELEPLLGRLAKAALSEAPKRTPEQTAWDTLTELQVTVSALESRIKEKEAASLHRARANALLTEYEKARDSVLQELYGRIAGRFGDFYCALHDHEKDHFQALIQPDGASLNFEVDFLGRGTHPPHALHSEGHQDSMGLCLFLALGEELSRGQTDLIVLDDVMMSVDAGHRKDVCRLLTDMFPDRQFLITTHDKNWAKQLKQERVVDPQRVIEFTSWTIETGPRLHQQRELWEAISEDLDRGDVGEAAFKLRRGSEDFFESVCDNLAARIIYNSTGQWQLGDWLPAAMEQYKQLLLRARRSARSWGNSESLAELDELESVRSQIYGRTHVEWWAIDAAVHYNNWEDMSEDDFSPVVDAFQVLHALFICSGCGGFIEALPRGNSPETVKCPCSKIYWNLTQKPSG